MNGEIFPSGPDFRAMVQGLDSGILIHEAASKNILWANEAACRMFGFRLEELRPLKAHHMSSPDQRYRRDVGVAWLQEAVVRGESRRRWKYRAKNGEVFLTDAVAKRLDFRDGPVVMVVFRGVTPEDDLRAELDRAEGYLQRLMVSASAGIALLDEENRVQDISDFAARLLGTTAEEAAGQRLDALATPSLPLDGEVVSGHLAHPGDPVEVTFEVDAEDGTRWLSVDIEVVRHDGIQSRLAAFRDVTEREELARHNEYQQARLQYMSRYNAMGDMAMTIAHELGQPLAAARNSLMGLQARHASGNLSTEDFEYGLDLAARQLTRSAQIVSSVKRYVQRIETSMAVEDLDDVVADALYFAQLRAREKGIELQADLSEEPLPVKVDQILIGQVVINLCFNAVDEVSEAISEGLTPPPVVELTCFREGEWACFSVADQGRGLVEPTDQAFSTKQDGAGIGLIICERIIERHGGELVFTPGEPGTIATGRLPLVEDSGSSEE